MTITMRREPLDEGLWAELMPLIRRHWEEIAHYPDIPLLPDADTYQILEDQGMIRCFVARDGRTLVGYAIFFVRRALHYAGSLQASQDVLYVDPVARGGLGTRFIRWCDEQLALEQIQVVYHHVKVNHNFGRMLERQGYELVDLIFAKRLDKESV